MTEDRDDPLALDALDRVTVGDHGGDRRSDEAQIKTDNISLDIEPTHGNSAQYALRKLRRSRPDVVEDKPVTTRRDVADVRRALAKRGE